MRRKTVNFSADGDQLLFKISKRSMRTDVHVEGDFGGGIFTIGKSLTLGGTIIPLEDYSGAAWEATDNRTGILELVADGDIYIYGTLAGATAPDLDVTLMY